MCVVVLGSDITICFVLFLFWFTSQKFLPNVLKQLISVLIISYLEVSSASKNLTKIPHWKHHIIYLRKLKKEKKSRSFYCMNQLMLS